MTPFTLDDLEHIVAERSSASPDESYTAKLLSKGIAVSAKKFGEEAVETVIAAIRNDRQELINESADLLYHWLVVLRAANIPVTDVMNELQRRTSQSGIAEKASRTNR